MTNGVVFDLKKIKSIGKRYNLRTQLLQDRIFATLFVEMVEAVKKGREGWVPSSSQAQELQKLMGFFKLDGQEPAAKPATAAAPPRPARQTQPVARSGSNPRPALTKSAVRTPPVIRPVPIEKKASTATSAASEEWEEF